MDTIINLANSGNFHRLNYGANSSKGIERGRAGDGLGAEGSESETKPMEVPTKVGAGLQYRHIGPSLTASFTPSDEQSRSKSDTEFAKTFYPTLRRVVENLETDRLSVARGVANTLDLDALNVFLRIGTFIGTDTPFRQLRADPPDYEWAKTIRPTELSRAAIIDAYIDLFRLAVARCDDGEKINLPLSGGQDSRHILLELCEQGRKPQKCWTVAVPWKPFEAEIAGQLCKSLDIPHTTFVPKGDIARGEAKKNLLTDYSSTQHCWMAEAVMAGLVKRTVVFDGIAGDVLSAGLFLTDARIQMLMRGRLDELVEDIVGPEENVFGVDDETLFPRWRALEKVSEEFRKHLGAPDPISSFYFWNRTRRDIGCSPFKLLRLSAQGVHTPYLDPEVCRFLASLPPSVTVSHTLHAETITRAYPDFAHISYAVASPDFKSAGPFFRRIAINAIGYLIKKDC
jgi:hypothetical protein